MLRVRFDNLSSGGNSVVIRGADGWTYHYVHVNNDSGYLYVVGSGTCSGGLHMVNVQDPVNPVGAGCVSSGGYVHDTQCVVYDGPDADHPTLQPEALLAGYLRGWFPMDEEGARGEVGLYEADPRGVIPIDGFRVPRTVARAREMLADPRAQAHFEVAGFNAGRHEQRHLLTPPLRVVGVHDLQGQPWVRHDRSDPTSPLWPRHLPRIRPGMRRPGR